MSGSENEERKRDDLQSLPPTPESHPLEEYSDAPSASSTNSRRKYQRGGRKKSTSTRESRKSRIGPLAEPTPVDEEDEAFERAERELIQDEPDEGIGEEIHDDPEEEYYEEEEEEEQPQQPAHREPTSPPKSESYCPNCAAKTQQAQPQTQQKAPLPFETGIKAFNLKRAESSGGRPIGVRAHPSSSGKKPSKSKTGKRPGEKKKKSKKARVESESDEEGSVDSFEEQKQKPMSIRLDLNLMVEIFLKAKIKGDVTITFL